MEAREKFEALPEIKIRLIGMVFCFSKNEYIPKNKILIEVVENTNQVNLAWYAFQEQQKIINMQECGANQIIKILNNFESSEKPASFYLRKIKELLK